MKMRLLIGRVVYIATWPFTWLILKDSLRTRVLIVHRGQALVIHSWHNDKLWTLPGGGVHKGERTKTAALRELYEELGISLHANDLVSLGTIDNQKRGRYRLEMFGVKASKKMPYRLKSLEVSGAEWVPTRLLNARNTEPNTLQHIAAWNKATRSGKLKSRAASRDR